MATALVISRTSLVWGHSHLKRLCGCECVRVTCWLPPRPCIMHLLLFFCTWYSGNQWLGRGLSFFSFTNQSHVWCPHKPHSLDSCPLMGFTINYIKSNNVHSISSCYSSRDLVIARQLASCHWRNARLPLGKIFRTAWERLFPEWTLPASLSALATTE